jgi:exonuclease V gamma subunit
MNLLYLAPDAESLANQLAAEVRAQQTPDRYFVPQTVVVPNRFVEQWLKLHLARELGVAINLRFTFLEHALWDWLRAIDPRRHDSPPELLDAQTYEVLVLSTLLLAEDPDLKPLQEFCERPDDGAGVEAVARLSRLASRRAWDMSARLGSLIRDYEYHRQEAIIQPWLAGATAFPPGPWRERELAQRCIFRHITREHNGKRARLNQATGRNLKTLPQYVMEFVHEFDERLTPPRRFVHLFDLTQISPLHLRALGLVMDSFDWRVYHPSPFVAGLSGSVDGAGLRAFAESYRAAERDGESTETDLRRLWGRAGAESLYLAAGFLDHPSFQASLLPEKPVQDRETSVLRSLQRRLLGRADDEARLPQDRSLQIVGCPGIRREVETVHNNILHQLRNDPKLRQTDIAILVSDMARYRPALTAVFERPPRLLEYNLGDYTAESLSVFGQALLGMLDLALESFTRSRVFDVLLNPCFLAKLGLSRGDARLWLTWADELGVHHGWDSHEKKDQGLYPSIYYTWKQGLRRLRLGRYMRGHDRDDDEPALHWQEMVPFADIHSLERDKLDAFCRAVEGFLPVVLRLRKYRSSGQNWAEALRRLIARFFAIPEERPEEERVRDSILAALERLEHWDRLDGEPRGPDLPVELVREFVAGQLREISARHNDLLAGGVTIAALQPGRAIPFAMVYLVGMGADLFPGSPFLSPLDLRHATRQPGDIQPIEQQRFAFLEALLMPERRLFITYNCRDLQRDQELLPAVPLFQLKRFLDRHVTAAPMEFAKVPLLACDAKLVGDTPGPDGHDAFVQYQSAERMLALETARQRGELPAPLDDDPQHVQERRRCSPSFAVGPVEARNPGHVPIVSIRQLRRFLENPASAALHSLGVESYEDEEANDHEPFVSSKRLATQLAERVLADLVRRAEAESLPAALAKWRERFDAVYDEAKRCSMLPEHGFATVDRRTLQDELAECIEGSKGLGAFLQRQAGKQVAGPLVVGDALTPKKVRLQTPAVELDLERPLSTVPSGKARLVGGFAHAWTSADEFELLVVGGNLRGASGDRNSGKDPLERDLFEALLVLLTFAAAEHPQVARCDKWQIHCVRGGTVKSFPVFVRPPDRARWYLTQLVTDALDPACAELLPFFVVRANAGLSAAYQDQDCDSNAYAARLEAAIANARFHHSYLAKFEDAGFELPLDPYRRVRQRFTPLYRLLMTAAVEPRRDETAEVLTEGANDDGEEVDE